MGWKGTPTRKYALGTPSPCHAEPAFPHPRTNDVLEGRMTMDKGGVVLGCACCRMNRRRFLAAGCAACAGAAGLLVNPGALSAAQAGAGKMKIRIIYALHAAQQ